MDRFIPIYFITIILYLWDCHVSLRSLAMTA